MSDLPPSGPDQPAPTDEAAPPAPADQPGGAAVGEAGPTPAATLSEEARPAGAGPALAPLVPLLPLLDDPAGLVAVSVAGAVADALSDDDEAGADDGADGPPGGGPEGAEGEGPAIDAQHTDEDAPSDDLSLHARGGPPDGGAAGEPKVRASGAPPASPPEDPRYVRCFLAVNFPLVTVRRIAEEITALKGPVAAAGLSVKWVTAPNLHLTLKFLGPVPRPVIEAIAARLGAGLRGLRPFEIEARGLGAFPSLERPKVLWVGLREEPALRALQRAVDGWMGELGFAAEEREFHPHLTIGRVVGGRGEGGELGALFGERGGRAFGTGRVVEVVVYESRTLARGAEYHALARVAVGAPRIPGAG